MYIEHLLLVQLGSGPIEIRNLHNPALVKIDTFLWGLSLLSTSLYE